MESEELEDYRFIASWSDGICLVVFGPPFEIFPRVVCAAPMVRFLKEQLEKAGCALGDNFIKAVNCDGKVSGGYMPGLGVYEFELPACIIGNEVDPRVYIMGLMLNSRKFRSSHIIWWIC